MNTQKQNFNNSSMFDESKIAFAPSSFERMVNMLSEESVQTKALRNALSHILALGRTIEQLFFQQYSLICFHNDNENNFYKTEDDRLVRIMTDTTISNEKKIECAKILLKLLENYTRIVALPLEALYDKLQHNIAVISKEISLLSNIDVEENMKCIDDLKKWVILSEEYNSARKIATDAVSISLYIDKKIPEAIIVSHGKVNAFSSEESEKYAKDLAHYSHLSKTYMQTREKIEKERDALVEFLFGKIEDVGSNNTQKHTPKNIAFLIWKKCSHLVSNTYQFAYGLFFENKR